MKHVLPVLLIALAVAGCGKKPATPAAPTPAPEDSLGALPAIQVPDGRADEVVARVGTHKLTRGQAMQDVDIRLASIAAQVPPAELERMRQQQLGRIVEQFVIRSVLLDEASKTGLAVTPEDEQKAFEKIDTHLKSQGRSLEEALESSPIGKERMLQEVHAGITIEKLLAARLPDVSAPTDEEVDAFIAEHAERLNRPERVHARHILVSNDGTADDEASRMAKREEVEALQKSLAAGGDFEAAAREHSSCPSAARGGDLGWFGKGQMVPAFEEAAFTQATNAVGPVVETQFGYHIIQVLEHEQAGMLPREEVIEIVKQRSRQEGMKTLIDELTAQADVEYSDAIKPLLPPTQPPPMPQAAQQPPAPPPAQPPVQQQPPQP